ncbi:MAG: hypothetical protein HC908_02525 [Calothrix sp. SM1_7_51]|nr:hypothetical protein [Calothrix sp. SM1_7_51]
MQYWTIKVLIIIVLLVPLSIGFVNPMGFAAPKNPASSNTRVQTQGVRGTVVRLTGNQMPTVGENRRRSTPQFVKTTVWVFSGRILANSRTRIPLNEAKQKFNYVTKVNTDNKGNFFVKLPRGEYTIFAQYGNDLYLNSFQGDGSFNTVQVTDGKTTELRLVNNENATF